MQGIYLCNFAGCEPSSGHKSINCSLHSNRFIYLHIRLKTSKVNKGKTLHETNNQILKKKLSQWVSLEGPEARNRTHPKGVTPPTRWDKHKTHILNIAQKCDYFNHRTPHDATFNMLQNHHPQPHKNHKPTLHPTHPQLQACWKVQD